MAALPAQRVLLIEEDGSERVFPSLTQASKELHMHLKTIRAYAMNGQLTRGRRFRYVDAGYESAGRPQAVELDEETRVNPMTFIFGPEAGDLFNGLSVRATRQPQRVSIIDIIQVVCNVGNPHQTWGRVCELYGQAEVLPFVEDFQYPGQGQRPTPSTNLEGTITLINLLPGTRAAAFRATGVRLLIRYLGGDESLAGEVQAINQMHQSGATHGTALGMFRDAVLQENTTVAVVAQEPQHRLALVSPTMAGMSLWDFRMKKVCYLLLFPTVSPNTIPLIKFGKTDDPERRIKEHLRELPAGTTIYCIHECAENAKAEGEFKSWGQLGGFLTQDARPHVEVLKGVDPVVAEQKLVSIIDSLKDQTHTTDSMLRSQQLDIKQQALAMLTTILPQFSNNPDICASLIQLANNCITMQLT